MKKWLVFLFVLLLAVPLTPAVLAQDDCPPVGRYNLTLETNLRDAAGGNVIGKLNPGQNVTVSGDCEEAVVDGFNYQWTSVIVNNDDPKFGWIVVNSLVSVVVDTIVDAPIASTSPAQGQVIDECLYTVKAGDSLRSVAEAYDLTSWEELAEANDITTASQFRTGVILTIPDCEDLGSITAGGASLGDITASDSTRSAGNGEWVITWHEGADLDRGDGTTFRDTAEEWIWQNLAPELWPTFPNQPNPLVPSFRVVTCADNPAAQCVPDGVEYANAESNFCQQLAGEACRFPIAPNHYMYYTGDYQIELLDAECEGGVEGRGCMWIGVNVGKVSSDMEAVFSQGFRLHARYWNGDEMDQGIGALASHGAANMLGFPTSINPLGSVNAGGNCSSADACGELYARIDFVSGNEPLATLEVTYERAS